MHFITLGPAGPGEPCESNIGSQVSILNTYFDGYEVLGPKTNVSWKSQNTLWSRTIQNLTWNESSLLVVGATLWPFGTSANHRVCQKVRRFLWIFCHCVHGNIMYQTYEWYRYLLSQSGGTQSGILACPGVGLKKKWYRISRVITLFCCGPCRFWVYHFRPQDGGTL